MAQHGGGQDHQEGHERDHMGHPPHLVPAVHRASVDEGGQRVADEAPALVVGQAVGRNAERLGAEAGHADGQQDAADDRVLGPGLDADAVGPPRRRAEAAHDGPHHPDHEHRPGGVAHRGVGPVDVSVQEFEPVGELMVDLQGGGHAQQNQEAEVDEGVHHPGARLSQQGAHVDAGSEVGHAVLGVVHRGAAVVGPAPLPVLDPVGEQDGPVHQQHGDDRVEGDLQRRGNVAEYLAGDRAVVVEAGDARHDARQAAVNSAMATPRETTM